MERNTKAAGSNIKSTFINQIALIRILSLSVRFCESLLKSEPGSAVHGSEKKHEHRQEQKHSQIRRIHSDILLQTEGKHVVADICQDVFPPNICWPTFLLFYMAVWREANTVHAQDGV